MHLMISSKKSQSINQLVSRTEQAVLQKRWDPGIQDPKNISKVLALRRLYVLHGLNVDRQVTKCLFSLLHKWIFYDYFIYLMISIYTMLAVELYIKQ